VWAKTPRGPFIIRPQAKVKSAARPVFIGNSAAGRLGKPPPSRPPDKASDTFNIGAREFRSFRAPACRIWLPRLRGASL